MDKGTELVIKTIYDEMKKDDPLLDWYWVKQEAVRLLAGESPSGSVGKSVYDHLKKMGKV
jgi:hypothetical protein